MKSWTYISNKEYSPFLGTGDVAWMIDTGNFFPNKMEHGYRRFHSSVVLDYNRETAELVVSKNPYNISMEKILANIDVAKATDVLNLKDILLIKRKYYAKST